MSTSEPAPPLDAVAWEQFPLDPSWKGCRSCGEDVLGARLGVRPVLPGQKPEGMVLRVCSNCGHVTTMGPTHPEVAALWPREGVVSLPADSAQSAATDASRAADAPGPSCPSTYRPEGT